MRIHLSADDSLSVFRELTENAGELASAFSCPRLAYYRELHEKYGAKITLYCFMRDGGFSICESTEKFAQELASCGDWLRFGFHSADASADMAKAPFSESAEAFLRTSEALRRITGREPTDCLRLHFFAATAELRCFLYENGVRALLGADDERVSYALTQGADAALKRCGECIDPETGLHIVKTAVRLEKFEDVRGALDAAIMRYPALPLVVFTHDQLPQGIARLEAAARYGCENGFEFI